MQPMRKATAGTLGRVIKSVPGVAVLVIALGVGVAYAATGKDGECDPADAGSPRHDVMIAPDPGFGAFGAAGKDLSEADRKSLEAFGVCMREKAPQPGDGTQPPDPADGKAAFESAFDACKAELSDELRTQFEEGQAKAEEYRACLEENGAPEPPQLPSGGELPEPPSKADIKAMLNSQEACLDKLPEGDFGGPMLHVRPAPAPGGRGAAGTVEFHTSQG